MNLGEESSESNASFTFIAYVARAKYAELTFSQFPMYVLAESASQQVDY